MKLGWKQWHYQIPQIVSTNDGICIQHHPGRMLQILSLKLDKISVDGDLVELYGYIAVRDDVDPLLNYVVNFSRDEPITVEQVHMITSKDKST